MPHHAPDSTPSVVPFSRWRVEPARRLPSVPGGKSAPARWRLDELSGRLSELSGLGDAAQLTLAFALVREAQRRGEPAAWITAGGSTFFPPDAATGGVDLARLPVVFAPDASLAARAASRLARSDGFGLIVVDLAGASLAAPSFTGRRGGHPLDAARMTEVPLPLQSRLTGLAQTHDVAVVFLTEKTSESPSLGTLVSLRGAARRERGEGGRYLCRVEAVKDKRRGPGWSHTEVRRGPAGLC